MTKMAKQPVKTVAPVKTKKTAPVAEPVVAEPVKAKKTTPKDTTSTTTASSDIRTLCACLEMASAQMEAALKGLSEQALKVKTKNTFPVALAEAGYYIRSDLSKLSAASDAIRSVVIAHDKAGGAFEQGNYAVSVTETEKSATPWKDVALQYAKLYAEAKGRAFKQDVFVAKLAKTYTTKTTSVTYNPVAGSGKKS